MFTHFTQYPIPVLAGNVFGKDGIELLKESLDAKGLVDALGSLSDDEGGDSDEEEGDEEEGGSGEDSTGEGNLSREGDLSREEPPQKVPPEGDDGSPCEKDKMVRCVHKVACGNLILLIVADG